MREFKRILLFTGWALSCLLIGSLTILAPTAHADDDDEKVKSVQTFWNLTYNHGAGEGGVCDWAIPILSNDQRTVVDGDEQSDAPPIRLKGTPRPVIVMVHGGGWVSGDKFMMGGFAESIAQSGVCVININYRHAPQHPFPAQLDDIRTAMLYVSKQAPTLSLDLNRLALFGYSAGGHLSLLLSVLDDEPMSTKFKTSDWAADDPRWKQLPKIASVCAGGPPCDFTQLLPDNRTFAFFLRGSPSEFPELYRVASPIIHTSPNDPPTTLIHGNTDLIVPVSNSVEMAAALREKNVAVKTTIIPNSGHLLTFVSPEMKQAVADFVNQLRSQTKSPTLR